MSRWLVANADDAGMHPSTDDAILRCAAAGVLKSASVFIQGPTAPAFVDRALHAGLGLGLHFNLTEGRALTGHVGALTHRSGEFLGDKHRTWSIALAGGVSQEAIGAEFLAQFQRARALGYEPEHVNGHQHVHVLPSIRDAVREALLQLGARPWVRVPNGHASTILVSGLDPAVLREHAHALRMLLQAEFPMTTAFCGLAFAEQPTEAEYLRELPTDPSATVEFMLHPGARPGSPFTEHAHREREAHVLCSPRLHAALKDRGWHLSSFQGLPRP